MSTPETDVPAGLTFVDPDAAGQAFRVVLWAAPGEGKTAGAASAPGPILAVSADRPRAWQFARLHYPDKDIREARFTGPQTLADVYRYLKEHPEIRTVVLDPWQTIYNSIVDTTPLAGGQVDYQGVNKRVLRFLHALREFDANVVIVAHERLNDGNRGDGKLYPQLGGPSLINEILKESDVVARVEREPGIDDQPERYMAQLRPRDNLVCKDSLQLGERRELNLTEWFEEAATRERTAKGEPMPWDPDYEGDDAEASNVVPITQVDPQEFRATLDKDSSPSYPPATPEENVRAREEGQTIAQVEHPSVQDLADAMVAKGVGVTRLRKILKGLSIDAPAQLGSADLLRGFFETLEGPQRSAVLIAIVHSANQEPAPA